MFPVAIVRLVLGAAAAAVAALVLWPSFSLREVLLVAAVVSTLASGLDVIVKDYIAFTRGAYRAIILKSGLSWPLALGTWAFCGLILLFLVPTVVRPAKTLVQYDQVTVLVLATAVIGMLPLIYRAAAALASAFISRMRALWVVFLVIVGLTTAAIQITIGAAVRVDPGWDAGVVLDTATALSQGSHYDFAEQYYAWYPNNLMLTWLFWVCFAAARSIGITDTLMVGIVLHSLAMSLGVVLVASVAKRISGYVTAVLFIGFSFVFVAFGGWNGVPYSDTIGMVFPAVILWLFVASQGGRPVTRLLMWTTAALITAVGAQIKPTVVFAFLAACAVTLLWKSPGKAPQSMVSRIATVAVAGALLGGASVLVQNALLGAGVVRTDLRADQEQVPLTHFLKMGATGLGGFQQQDVWETQGIIDPQERFQNGIDVYVERLREMGAIGYAQQVVTKMSWSVGDGSFYAWAEGVTHLKTNYPATDPASALVRDYFTAAGPHALLIRTVWQSVWLVVLLLIVAPFALRRRGLFNSSATMVRVALLALVVFLCLFENRARCLYLYVPYFLLGASMTIAAGASMARSAVRRRGA